MSETNGNPPSGEPPHVEPIDVPVEPIGDPLPPESIGKPDDHEAKMALAALKAGKPLQDGVPEGAKVEDFKL